MLHCVFRVTFQPDGNLMRVLTVVNVIMGVVAAAIMPNHAAFMHRNALVWVVVYAFDILHALFMYALALFDDLLRCE